MGGCPTHGDDGADRHPSLLVWEVSGRPWFKCQAGCSKEDILSALGLTWHDVNATQTDPRAERLTKQPTMAQDRSTGALPWFADYLGAPSEFLKKLPIDAEGKEIVFRFDGLFVTKLRQSRRKSFRWHPEGMASPPLWPMPGDSLPERIWVTEGESDCIVARHVGLDAYVLTRGAVTTLTPREASALRERGVAQVVLCLDADMPGEDALGKHVACFASAGFEVLACDVSAMTDALSAAKYLRDTWLQSDRDETTFRERLEKCVSATIEMDRGRNESWHPVPITELPGEPDLDWMWEVFLARGLIADLYGLWKAGKSTLLGASLHHMGEGGLLAGRKVRKGCALVVTEEMSVLWKRRQKLMDIGSHVHVISRPFKSNPTQQDWEDFLQHVRLLVPDYDLIVFDTLPSLWPVARENEAGEVIRALRPLHECVGNAALLLVRHPRKGDGTDATAGRGSGALSGFVDVIVEFRRYRNEERSDTRRVLTVYSRETPFECVVDRDGSYGYEHTGDRADVTSQDRIAVFLGMLGGGEVLTSEELLDTWPEGRIPKPGRATLLEDLESATEGGQLIRCGDGKKGSPYTWSKVADPQDTSDVEQAA